MVKCILPVAISVTRYGRVHGALHLSTVESPRSPHTQQTPQSPSLRFSGNFVEEHLFWLSCSDGKVLLIPLCLIFFHLRFSLFFLFGLIHGLGGFLYPLNRNKHGAYKDKWIPPVV